MKGHAFTYVKKTRIHAVLEQCCCHCYSIPLYEFLFSAQSPGKLRPMCLLHAYVWFTNDFQAFQIFFKFDSREKFSYILSTHKFHGRKWLVDNNDDNDNNNNNNSNSHCFPQGSLNMSFMPYCM